MDEFVSRRLKELGKDYFLTEFNVVNPTSLPFTFDLFNSNSNIDFPTTLTFAPPSNLSGIVSTTINDSAINTLNNTLYLTNTFLQQIEVYDCVTNSLITTIPLGVGISPSSIAYNSLTNEMYFCNFILTQIIRLDCNTNTIVGLPIPIISSVINQSIFYNPIKNSIYIFDLGNPAVQEIDCFTNTIVFTLVPTFFSLYATFNPLLNRFYISDGLTNDIVVWDCVTNTVVTNIPSGLINITQSSINTNNGLLYVIGITGIITINMATNTASAPIALPIFPSSITYNSINNLLYISGVDVLFNGQYIVFDPITNTFSTPIALGGATNVTFYIQSINKIIFCSLFGFQTLSSPLLPYISGTSYSYNQFNKDKLYQPFLLSCMMLYSFTPNNLNQAFFATTKDANGQIAKDPKIPALQISQYQFQASVSKVCFGKKGFILDESSSFTDFVVQPNSSITLVLIIKQLKFSKEFTNPITLCEKLDASVNQKLKILTSKPKNKLKEQKRIVKPFKNFFEEICSGADGEKEILENNISKQIQDLQEKEDNKSSNVAIPLLLVGGIILAISLKK